MIGLRPRATDKVTSRTAGVLEAEFHFFTAAATTAASQQKNASGGLADSFRELLITVARRS